MLTVFDDRENVISMSLRPPQLAGERPQISAPCSLPRTQFTLPRTQFIPQFIDDSCRICIT
jgi:hypothetical protein